MLLNILFAVSITIWIEPFIVSSVHKFDTKIFSVSAISNLILNPLMNLALSYIDTHYYVWLAAFEVMTILLETLTITFLTKGKLLKNLLIVFIANLVSFLVGYVSNIYLFPISDYIFTIVFLVLFIVHAIAVFLLNKKLR